MPKVYAGNCDHPVPQRFALVVARYNRTITEKLLDGAVSTLTAHGISDEDLEVAWVPGAWEIPLIAQQMATRGTFAGVICLGAVIRGETTHDQYINSQVSSSLGRIALETGMPVLFGLLTCTTMEQAIHRAGGNVGNKGSECALAALEMASLMSQLVSPDSLE